MASSITRGCCWLPVPRWSLPYNRHLMLLLLLLLFLLLLVALLLEPRLGPSRR